MTAVTNRLGRARIAFALVVAALVTIGASGVASAHTDFDSSVPADGAVVEGPLDEIVVSFTNPARPAGEGFELLDPSGAIRAPSSIDATDGTSFVLTFDPPLEGGTYGLRWSVQAGDAHPIDGSFSFEVTSATAPAAAPAEAVPPQATGTVADHAEMSAADHASMSGGALDEFLDDSSTDPSVGLARTGRTMSMLGMVFALGVLASLVWTLRGSRDELVAQLNWVRLAGLVIFTGGLLQYGELTEADPTMTAADLFTTQPGLAAVLKMTGGLAILFGFHHRAGTIATPTRSLSAAVATDLGPAADAGRESSTRHAVGGDDHRWTPTTAAAVGVAGCALVLVSFWFDGHTVSRGPWVVHSFVNLVHLGAAAVWGGGVFAMATTAWMRRRRSERLGIAAMVVRFSSIATVSLVAVIIAGLAMTWIIVDGPGDLVGTSWGRTLLAKTAVVAVAAGLGGYNHLRLRPALERHPDDPDLARELRISLSIESAAFVAIVVLTAILVGAAV